MPNLEDICHCLTVRSVLNQVMVDYQKRYKIEANS